MTASNRDREVDQLLDNWANYARGGLAPSVANVLTEPTEELPIPVMVEAAEEVESVMTQCKRERADLWDYAKHHYLRRLTNREGAARLKLSVTIYKERRGKLLAWVDGRLRYHLTPQTHKKVAGVVVL